MPDPKFNPQIVTQPPKKKLISSNWFLAGAIVIFLIVVGLVGLAYFGGGLKAYENKDYGISMKYPGDWVLEENVEGTLAIFSSTKENSMDIYQESVNLVVQDLSSNPMDLNKYSETAVKQLMGVFTNVKM